MVGEAIEYPKHKPKNAIALRACRMGDVHIKQLIGKTTLADQLLFLWYCFLLVAASSIPFRTPDKSHGLPLMRKVV